MKLKMLAIDDDSITLTMLKSYLDTYSELEVDYVESATAAMKKINAEKYNIVMSDIVMPGTDGLTLIKSIREVDPLIHIIIMTSHSSLSYVIQALSEGALDFVTKPFNGKDEIDPVIQSSIDRWRRWRKVLRNIGNAQGA